MKEERIFLTPRLPKLRVININHLGIHGRKSFKSDSKVLAGESVAETLNPLEDQSFTMSAVRTSLRGSETTIGLNPYKSSLWRGPCKNWETFENKVLGIIDKIDKNGDKIENPISILAIPVADMKGIQNLYDLSFIEPDYNSHGLSENKVNRLRKIHSDFIYKIMDTLNSPQIRLEVFKNNVSIGDIILLPKINDYDIKLS